MAVDNDNKQQEQQKAPGEPMLRFKGRQWIVGANVLIMTLLAAGLLVFANYLAFTFNQKSDWTSSGINSLSEQTRKLMDGLDKKVWLTSLYRTFQDPEMEKQHEMFRTSVEDILELYQTEARTQVEVRTVNPARDRDEVLTLVERLRKKDAYQGEAEQHKAIVEAFNTKLAAEILALLQKEGETLEAAMQKNRKLQEVREYTVILMNCQALSQRLQNVKENVRALLSDDLPKYSAAVDAIKSFYDQFKAAMTEAGEWMAQVDKWSKRYEVKVAESKAFFAQASKRYEPVVKQVEAQLEKAKDLPQLKLEELDRQVRPDTIIVETEEEAKVLTFDDVWPPKQRGQFGQAMGNRFEDRRNAAEVEISSAILQLTEKKQTAVVFVRHGGQPLFFGGNPMMGGGQALYGGAKERLERANFLVKEWDLATKKEPPEFEEDENPDRIIWVLLKPEAQQPPPNLPPQMRQRPKMFGPTEREAVMAALGDDPRVLVFAGWVPPPRNPMMMASPPTYEYNDWLKEQWGLEVRYNFPVLQASAGSEPGKLVFRANPFQVTRYTLSEHPIVEPLKGLKGVFPEAAPLKRTDTIPDGVTLNDLIIVPNREDMWAEADLQALGKEYQQKLYVVKGEMDISGPFAIGVAAERTREEEPAGKIVVVSSRSFATDQVALQRGLVQTAQGFALILQNPANMDLMVNAIHWLNDNEGLIGKGIESRDIPRLDQLEPGTGLTVARTLAVGVWPALALVAGLVVWFVRRR